MSTAIPSDTMDTDEASEDINKIRKAFQKLLQIAGSSISTEGSFVLRDLTSFARSSLADAAELLEDQAGRAKDSLREVEQEVQDGQRDALGRDKERMEEEEGDVKIKFEHTMDSLKDTGSTAIGAGQGAKAKADKLADRTNSGLQESFHRVSTTPVASHPFSDLTIRFASALRMMKNTVQPSIRFSILLRSGSPKLKKWLLPTSIHSFTIQRLTSTCQKR